MVGRTKVKAGRKDGVEVIWERDNNDLNWVEIPSEAIVHRNGLLGNPVTN